MYCHFAHGVGELRYHQVSLSLEPGLKHWALGLNSIQDTFSPSSSPSLSLSLSLQASDWEKLNKTLTDALEHYNELHAVMNLVLFEEAMQHV